MLRLLCLGALCWVVSVGQAAPPVNGECPLRGAWKSNEPKTLASLQATGKVNDRQRALFENHYFGQLTMTYTCKEITVRYAGDSEILNYEILRQQGRRITIRTIEDDSDEGKLRELTLEPDAKCYSVPVTGLGFSEYFCRE